MTVPYAFGTATSAIPLSQLDSNFNTPITLGNTAIQLGNTVTTLNNMTMANVTISSVSTAITAAQGGTGLTAVGATGNVLTSNGTAWVSQASPSATPAGSTNQIQYNSSGSFAGSAGLTFDGTNFATTGTISGTNHIVTGGSASGNSMYLATTNAIGWSTNGTERMRVDASGNLGVGITSIPSYNANLRTVSFNNTSGVVHDYCVGGTRTGSIICQSGSFDISTQTASAALVLSTNGTERARIDTSGKMAIGADTISTVRLYVKGSGATSGTFGLYVDDSAASNLFYIRNDGAGYLKAASWTYGSDASLKENIKYLTPQECLGKLLQAKPATFDYINGQKENYGYVANDVEEWLPEAVPMLESGTRGLKDGFINVLGTGAIQALNQLIQEQQAIIEQLKADVAALKGAQA